MTLTSKFKKDLSTLRAAANKEIFLDVKNPKLYKKLKRYYVSEGLELTGEDPDYRIQKQDYYTKRYRDMYLCDNGMQLTTAIEDFEYTKWLDPEGVPAYRKHN